MSNLICSPAVSNFLKTSTLIDGRNTIGASKDYLAVPTKADLYQLSANDVTRNQIIGVQETDEYYIVIDTSKLSSSEGYALMDYAYLPYYTFYDKFIVKKGTSSQLQNSILADGEFAYTTDNRKLYFGSNKDEVTSSDLPVSTYLSNSDLPDGYGKIIVGTCGTSYTMSVTSSSGYVGYKFNGSTPSITGSGSKTFTTSGANRGTPKEIIFWPCTSATDMTKSAAHNITAINLSSGLISFIDVKRLPYLTSLLISSQSTLSSIDLSNNSLLTTFGISNTLPISIDLSSCPLVSSITSLVGVTSLTLDNNTALSSLGISSNSTLLTLNIRGCANISSLSVSGCPYLSSINVNSTSLTNNATITADGTDLTSDWFYQFCTSIRSLTSASINITVDASHNTKLAPYSIPVSPYFTPGAYHTSDEVNAAWPGKIQPLLTINSTTYTLT